MRAPARVLLVAVAACGGASQTVPGPDAPAPAPACGGAAVRDDAGLAAIAGCDAVAGDLLISGEGLSQLRVVALDRLRAVEGDLVIDDNPELVGVQLPVLEQVGGRLDVANNRALAAFGAPRLGVVAGALALQDHPALIDVDLTALASVGGDVIVSGSRELERLALPALTTVAGALRIEDNEALADLHLPQLSAVGGRVVIELNPALPASVAEAVADRVGAGDAVVEDNASGP